MHKGLNFSTSLRTSFSFCFWEKLEFGGFAFAHSALSWGGGAITNERALVQTITFVLSGSQHGALSTQYSDSGKMEKQVPQAAPEKSDHCMSGPVLSSSLGQAGSWGLPPSVKCCAAGLGGVR